MGIAARFLWLWIHARRDRTCRDAWPPGTSDCASSQEDARRAAGRTAPQGRFSVRPPASEANLHAPRGGNGVDAGSRRQGLRIGCRGCRKGSPGYSSKTIIQIAGVARPTAPAAAPSAIPSSWLQLLEQFRPRIGDKPVAIWHHDSWQTLRVEHGRSLDDLSLDQNVSRNGI